MYNEILLCCLRSTKDGKRFNDAGSCSVLIIRRSGLFCPTKIRDFKSDKMRLIVFQLIES